MNLAAAIYDRLASDATLTAMLSTYGGAPAVFTADPAPGDAELPYIVTAGQTADAPFDTKTTRGREVWRDVRCYAAASGSCVIVDQIAERVRVLVHRSPLTVDSHTNWLAEVSGPIAADEDDVYGRVLTLRLIMEEV